MPDLNNAAQEGAPLHMLPSLMRLANASARLCLRPCTELLDVVLAIKLVVEGHVAQVQSLT